METKLKSHIDEESEPKSQSKIESGSKIQSNTHSKSRIDSKIDSKVASNVEPEVDPFKDNNRLKILKKIASYSCVLITVLAVQYVILGIFAQWLYKEKSHLFIFGMLCLMHLIGCPIGYFAIKKGNRILFLMLMIVNLIWIICTITLLLLYWFIFDSPQFNSEAALHVGAVFYMICSLVLALACFLIMKQLHMIQIQITSPTVEVSPEGKAGQKRKQ